MHTIRHIILPLVWLLGYIPDQAQAQVPGQVPTQTSGCNIQVRGQVFDVDTHEKLEDATIEIKTNPKKTLISGHDGQFLFTNLCPGTYTIHISHVSCAPGSFQIQLTSDTMLTIQLSHYRSELQQVMVSGQKFIPNTGMKWEVSGRELDANRGLSIGDAMGKLNGITLLQNGATISKPVIHGLHGSRVLTINNGIRQEGQQWGNEHAPEIDPFVAEKISVIKGVDELKYGSDAIAGVILIEPKSLRNQPGTRAEFNTQYHTNNQQYLFSGLWEQQLKKLPALTYRLQGTFKKAANYTTPQYRLDNTGLQEENFSAAIAWRKENYQLESFYSQFHSQIGIFKGAHIGNLSDLENAIEQEKPAAIFTDDGRSYEIDRPSQEVTHRLGKIRGNFQSGQHKFRVTIGVQHNKRKEFDVIRGNSEAPQLTLSILTLSQDIQWIHPTVKNINGLVGVNLVQQDNQYKGRYFIPNYFSTTYGAYWIEKWARKKWEIQGGLRFDHKNIDTRRIRTGSVFVDNNFSFSTTAASLNFIHKFNNHFSANLNTSLASRAPYVNELLSDGIHHGTGTYEQGDINLQVEQSWNLIGGLSYTSHNKKFNSELVVYQNRIRDFIYQKPVPDEPVLTIVGAFPKIEYQQTDARLRGVDWMLQYDLSKNIALTGKWSMVRGYDLQAQDWLVWMPSDRYTLGATWNIPVAGKWSNTYVSADMMHVREQTRIPGKNSGLKVDYKEPPAAYTLFGLDAATTCQLGNVPVTIGITVRNLSNTVYREYLNQFRYFTDEMGRNILLRLKIPIEHF
jgi:iron complex outermembrane recepter protein